MNENSISGGAVAVLSGSGFIGSAVCRNLARDRRVVIVDDRTFAETSKFIASLPLDDEAAFRAEFTQLSACVDLTIGNEGLKRFFRCVRESGYKPRYIYVSSSAVYGDQPEEKPVLEDADLLTAHPYGLSKKASEEAIRSNADSLGVEAVILRLFNAYGEYQDPSKRLASVVGKFARAVARGNALTIVNGGIQTRDFLHVDDVAAAVRLCIDKPALSGTFNLGSGTGISLRGLIEQFEQRAGRSVMVEEMAGDGGIVYSVADTSRMKGATGFEPAIGLKEGLDRVWHVHAGLR